MKKEERQTSDTLGAIRPLPVSTARGSGTTAEMRVPGGTLGLARALVRVVRAAGETHGGL